MVTAQAAHDEASRAARGAAASANYAPRAPEPGELPLFGPGPEKPKEKPKRRAADDAGPWYEQLIARLAADEPERP